MTPQNGRFDAFGRAAIQGGVAVPRFGLSATVMTAVIGAALAGAASADTALRLPTDFPPATLQPAAFNFAGPPPSAPASFAAQAISTCRQAAREFQITAPAYAVGPIVCVYGDINKDMAKAFLQLDLQGATAVVVSSPGGSVASALDMTEHMGLDNQTLVVDGLCASSCANYLFLAARWKIVPDESLVGWHGAPPNPRQWTPPQEMPAFAAQFARDTMWRSEDFFYRVGVSDRVAREAPRGVDIEQLTPGAFWSHSRESLEWRYGVGGILLAPNTEQTIETATR